MDFLVTSLLVIVILITLIIYNIIKKDNQESLKTLQKKKELNIEDNDIENIIKEQNIIEEQKELEKIYKALRKYTFIIIFLYILYHI